MPELIVRPAIPADLPALLDLYAELAGTRSEALPARGSTAAEVFDQILSHPGRTVLVAAQGPRLVGTAEVLVAANLTHGGRPWALVESVVVAEEARRLGVGAALLETATAIARDAGCYRMQLVSRDERKEAHAFYRRIGFEASAQGFRRYLD